MDEQQLLNEGREFLNNNPKGKELLKELSNSNINSLNNKGDNYELIISTFITNGRVCDKFSSKPLKGVKIELISGLYPMKLINKPETRDIIDPLTNNKTRENFINSYYTYDSKGNKNIRTNDKGEFTLKFGAVTLKNINNKAIIPTKIIYNLDGYETEEQFIISGNGEIIQNLPIKPLMNIEKASQLQAEKIKQNINNISDKIVNLTLDTNEKLLIELKNRVLNLAKNIQNKLIPLALSILLVFGVTKLSLLSKSKCPNNDKLKECIRKRNSIASQLNQIYTLIIINSVLAGIFLYLSKIFKTGKITIGSLPFPVSTPPGIGVPYNLISKLEKIQELFQTLSDTNKELKKSVIISLMFLIASLIIILLLFRKIDKLINECSKENSIPMVDINQELIKLTKNQNLKEDNIDNLQKINGFTLGVVVDEKSKQGFGEGVLYSRYAIAKNSKGIIMLKGEPSFSSDPQILIDELSFYIRNKNLKAD